MKINYELLKNHTFVTKLAGFEHSDYIQKNETKTKVSLDDIPLVQGKNIKNGIFIEQFDWYINKGISDKLIRSKLTKDCILVPYVGSNLGEVGIFYHNYDCHLASNIAKIELIDDYFDLEYIKYYLQSPIGQKFLFQSKQGSGQPNITMDSIRNTQIINYSKEYQKKIVKLLKPIDDKIFLNNSINHELEKISKALYDYWFLQFDFPNEEGKPYKSSGGKMVWNDELNKEIPEGWEVTNLFNDNLFSIIDVGLKKFDKKIYLATANIDDGLFTKGNIVNYDNRESRANMQPKPYSVWFAKMKDSVKHLFIPKNSNWFTDKYILSTGLYGLQCNETSFAYVASYIRNKNFEIQKNLLAHGSTQKAISDDDLKNFKLIVPSIDILEKYAEKTNSIFEMIFSNLKENEELSSLRDFLLPLLMNGQVVIED